MNEMFKKMCDEAGIEFNEFPFDFPESAERNWPDIVEAIMWILKKRQDKTLEEILKTLSKHGKRIDECSIQR